MYKNLLSLIILLFCLSANSCKRVLHKSSTNYTPYEIEGNSPLVDKEVEEMIRPYKTDLDLVMNEVIGECMQDMPKSKPESLLGNWMADAIHEAAEKALGKKIAFAVQNYGGIRIPKVSKGPITKGKIFELMPFDNTLLYLELDADLVQQLLNQIAAYGGWPISRNLSFAIQDSMATEIMIKGKPLDPEETYLVLLPDYIANGGDDCHFLGAAKRIDSGKFIREVVIDHLEKMTAQSIPNTVDSTPRIKK